MHFHGKKLSFILSLPSFVLCASVSFDTSNSLLEAISIYNFVLFLTADGAFLLVTQMLLLFKYLVHIKFVIIIYIWICMYVCNIVILDDPFCPFDLYGPRVFALYVLPHRLCSSFFFTLCTLSTHTYTFICGDTIAFALLHVHYARYYNYPPFGAHLHMPMHNFVHIDTQVLLGVWFFLWFY